MNWHVPQTAEAAKTLTLSLMHSEARSIISERHVHRSSPSARSDGSYNIVDRPRLRKYTQGRRKPKCSPLVASPTTRAPARSQLRADIRSLYLGRCCSREVSALHNSIEHTPRAIVSQRAHAKTTFRYPQHSVEDTCRQSSRRLPTDVLTFVGHSTNRPQHASPR